VQVASLIHVCDGFGVCIAGLVTQVIGGGQILAEVFPPPGQPRAWRDMRLRFEAGGMTAGTYHRLLECPSLNRGQW
jgi:hypothetical protein